MPSTQEQQPVDLQKENTTEREKRPFFPLLGLALLAIGAIIPWWLSSFRLDPYPLGTINGATTEEISGESSVDSTGEAATEGKATLKALGDSSEGYAPVQGDEFQSYLAEKDVVLDYADEPDTEARIKALNGGDADIIFTSMEDFLTQKPKGKIVALLSRQEDEDPASIKVAVASEDALKSNPEGVDEFVKAYYNEVKSSEKAFDGNTKFFTASEAEDWVKSGTLEAKVGELTGKLKGEGKLANFDPNLGGLFAGASLGSLTGNPLQIGTKVAGDVTDAAKDLADKAGEAGTKVADGAGDAAKDLADKAGETGTKVADGAGDAAKDLAEKAGAVGSQVANSAGDAAASVAEKAGEVGSQVADGAGDTAASVAEKAGEVSSQVADGAGDIAASVAEKAGEVGSQVANSAGDAAASVANLAPGTTKQSGDKLEVLGEVKFNLDSADITPEARQKLDEVVAQIKKMNPTNATIKVQGHTSSRGDATTNQFLSQARAEAVVQYLKSQNLNYQFSAEGLASSQPITGTDPSAEVNQRTIVGLVEAGN